MRNSGGDMSAYLVGNSTITDLEAWQANYATAVIPQILKFGGEILVAEQESESIEGSPCHFTVVLRFPSMEALKKWWDSDEYQSIIHFRHETSKVNMVALCDGFVMPDPAE
jgi:uncharacterized protein (DUF1330 family)